MLLFGGLHSLPAQAQTSCSNASLSGTYFYLENGTAVEGSTSSPAPYAQFGKVISAGNGNLSGQGTENASDIPSQLSFTATYAVNADCSGMMTGTNTRQGGGSTGLWTSAVQLVHGGQEVLVATMDSEMVVTGRAYRAAAEGPSQCGNASLAGNYGWLGWNPRLAGAEGGAYPLGQDYVGGFVFDGEGGLSYTGTANPAVVGLGGQGTYSIAGDCSGTATFTIPGDTIHFLLGIVEGGDVLFLENDPASFGFGILEPDSPPSVLPQVAFGGGWYSALYFTNTASAAVSFTVNFTADDGTPLTVPGLGCTLTGCPYGNSSITVNIPALGTTIIEAPNTGSLAQGYATFTLPPGVSGYGVFRQSVTGRADQEAVVPFATANATSNTLVWDDTDFVTGVATANAGPVAATIAITLWDNNGNVVGTSSVALPPYQKTEGTLRSLPGLSGTVGLRGRAQFAATSGDVAVLGLRFKGSAFTSIPATQP
jgi:hypothetical protein